MRGKYSSTVCHTILHILIAVLFLSVATRGHNPAAQRPSGFSFQGEYRQDGGQWLPLCEDTELSALEGDLILRGGFDINIPEGKRISFYLNHIEYSIYVNGELAARSTAWEQPLTASSCAKDWGSFTSPGIRTEDTVEIHLCNLHHAGNVKAYEELLDSFFLAEKELLLGSVDKLDVFGRFAGVPMLVLAVVIIGIALAFTLMRHPIGKQLWSLGFLSFCMGGYMALDTKDVALWSDTTAFNTYGQLLCMMLAAFELSAFAASFLTTKAKSVVRITTYLEGVFLVVVIMLCLANRIVIYDTQIPWGVLQAVIRPVQFGCCVYEWQKRRQQRTMRLLACSTMIAAVMAELVNSLLLWWPVGLLSKIVAIVLFVLLLVWGIRYVPISYGKAAQTDKMEGDLKNSRIIMAINQIRTHFVFNVLNAISGMCKYDPEKADRTVVMFARYLRTNIDIMQDDQPVTFHAALRHLEDYIALEQIRFGDKIRFMTDLTVDKFMIPPLILQPIVENAIKHGLMPKAEGGTIILRTWEDKRNVYISIWDDGVGFDVSGIDTEKSVGLSNARFRLNHIMEGSLKIESKPGQGTTVTVRLPWETAQGNL